MMPMLTGRSTVVFRPALSGMNAPNGTFMNRLLSTIHAEWSGPFSARSTSRSRLSVLSKPLGKTCGGRLLFGLASRTSTGPSPPTTKRKTDIITTRISVRDMKRLLTTSALDRCTTVPLSCRATAA